MQDYEVRQIPQTTGMFGPPPPVAPQAPEPVITKPTPPPAPPKPSPEQQLQDGGFVRRGGLWTRARR